MGGYYGVRQVGHLYFEGFSWQKPQSAGGVAAMSAVVLVLGNLRADVKVNFWCNRAVTRLTSARVHVQQGPQ